MVSARDNDWGWEIEEEGVGFGRVREVEVEVGAPAARASAAVQRGPFGGGDKLGGAILGAENLGVWYHDNCIIDCIDLGSRGRFI
jgi:hypothetical protein